MNQAKAKSFLETASNIAVIVVALVIVGSLARSYFRSAPAVLLERGLRKGANFPRFQELTSANRKGHSS